MQVSASPDSNTVCIAGWGIVIQSDFEVASGVILRPNPPRHDLDTIATGCEHFGEYATVLAMQDRATFFLEVTETGDVSSRAAKAWNCLWLFHLFALGCRCSCNPLYTWAGNAKVRFSVCTPHVVTLAQDASKPATTEQLEWARSNLDKFDSLTKDETFVSSLLSFVNSHHLFGFESRIMQIWSGIECLFKVNNEIARTIALYSALLLEASSPEARFECYRRVKKEYGVRSMVVHGTAGKKTSLEDAYARASGILVALLARCVELGRVPSAEELDRAAVMGFIAS